MATSKKVETSHESLLNQVEEYFRARGKSIKSDLNGKTHEEVLQLLQNEIDATEESDKIWKVLYTINDRFPLWKNQRDNYEFHMNLKAIGYPGLLPHIDTIKSVNLKDSKLELIHEAPGDQDNSSDESGHRVQLAGHIISKSSADKFEKRGRPRATYTTQVVSPSGNSGYADPVNIPNVSGSAGFTVTVDSRWERRVRERAAEALQDHLGEVTLQDARISSGRTGLTGSSGTSGTAGSSEFLTGAPGNLESTSEAMEYIWGFDPPNPSPQREG